MVEVNFIGQPLQYTKNGSIDGCGVRLLGITDPVPGVRNVHVIDVSFNVVNPGGGLVKGGLMLLPIQALQAQNLKATTEVPIKSVWLKAPGSEITRPTTAKPLPATTHRHALMYGTQLTPVLDLVLAMTEGKPIQVGFHVTKQDMETVFFGTVTMTGAESAQFNDCYDAWTSALVKRLEDAKR